MLTRQELKPGLRCNWIGQPERLIYMGTRHYPGDRRTWFQFSLVGKDPEVCWCEVLESDLGGFEISPTLPLWYVRAEDVLGESLDLLVRADSEQGAEQSWKTYWSSGGLYDFNRPKWVGRIPDTPQAGPIPWAAINPNLHPKG